MEIKNVRTEDLRPYENNPRRNTNAVPKVAESIRRFGFLQPIVATKDGTIIVGHTRYKAAVELGLETVPVVYAEDLTEREANTYRLADNKSSEESFWDEELLALELEELGEEDMKALGFDQDKVNLFAEVDSGSYKPEGKDLPDFAATLNFTKEDYAAVRKWIDAEGKRAVVEEIVSICRGGD